MSEKIMLTEEELRLSDRLEQVIQFGGAISAITGSGVVRNNAEFLKSLARIALRWRSVAQEATRKAAEQARQAEKRLDEKIDRMRTVHEERIRVYERRLADQSAQLAETQARLGRAENERDSLAKANRNAGADNAASRLDELRTDLASIAKQSDSTRSFIAGHLADLHRQITGVAVKAEMYSHAQSRPSSTAFRERVPVADQVENCKGR